MLLLQTEQTIQMKKERELELRRGLEMIVLVLLLSANTDNQLQYIPTAATQTISYRALVQMAECV